VILLDTNVLIYASTQNSPFEAWSKQIIADAVVTQGAAVNAISLAEICAGENQPEKVADTIRSWGINILDIPAAAAEISAIAYRDYRKRRHIHSDKDSPITPLPDFFIGAHAQIMGWSLATADLGRFQTYFPSVILITP